eukprot:754180-Alexandrium_andersonii.AAC.1
MSGAAREEPLRGEEPLGKSAVFVGRQPARVHKKLFRTARNWLKHHSALAESCKSTGWVARCTCALADIRRPPPHCVVSHGTFEDSNTMSPRGG